ncbi:peptidoglycan editing factor PgeF [Salibacterium qingdaonense]|uniref:Purine nucleoside phosphorylase n=1 Tax=Salibacterium qingdaonense TaxID=266892 RepID=A0A1I4IYT1_9BACI|nr:peptidoglycan editing factor PgeF [Salibacterium qingdaonense]SFL59133.1 conserved hypothetical protein [Salibacterium qingdaonense]
MEQEPFYRFDNRHWRVKTEILPKEVTAGISSRSGGVSEWPYDSLNTAFHVGDDSRAVRENRRLTAESAGFPLKNWVAAEQVHKADILKVDNTHRGMGALERESNAGNYDGLYTRENDILLVSLYADCVPLLFSAPGYACIGSAHAGWRGTSMNIAGKFVSTWHTDEGVPPEDVHAVIGPAVSERVYEVDDVVIDAMRNVLPENECAPWKASSSGKWFLSVKEMNRLLLKQAGVPPEQIYMSPRCTYLEEENFFSHRRDGSASGRMAAFIGMN